MKQILVITPGFELASFRVRLGGLADLLKAKGFELVARERPRGSRQSRALYRSAGDYHAVILQRKLLSPVDAFILRRHARRILYDVDDAVMFHSHEVGWLTRWRKNLRFLATSRMLDHVVAGNDYLADIFRRQHCAVSVLPSTVDPALYPVKNHQPTDTPRLVWIGSDWTLPYLRAMLPAIEAAAREVAGLRLVIIGGQERLNSTLPVEMVRWSLEKESEELSRCDIGLAPNPVDPWTLGKCGYKIIQYMAAGLPVIASPVGANARIVLPGQTGLLPSKPEEWTSAIIQLCRDGQLRQQMGQAGRRRVETDYNLQLAADGWVRLLND